MDASRSELSKEAVMSVHMKGKADYSALQRQGLLPFITRLSVTEPFPGPSPPLQGLRPISISELKVGKVHHGRVLMGTLCADAFIMTAVATVVQDEKDPSLAVRVGIYNAASSTSSIASVQKLYPKNARIAIKEPYLKRAADGLLAVRVENPANMEKIDANQTSAYRNRQDNNGDDGPLQLKGKGNTFFGKQDWKSAIDCYSKCISMIAQKEKKENACLLLAAYSNRAESWMRLGTYKEALKDSESALAIDPHHSKSQYRKGRALHGLLRFQEASECLQDLLSHHPELNDVRAFLDTVKEGSNSASKMIKGYSDFVLHRKSIPQFLDYVGPVVVRHTEDGRGRGLFATARVGPGDLLLASNALAFSVQDMKRLKIHQDSSVHAVIAACQEDLVAELVKKGTKSSGFLHQIYNLASSNGVRMEVPSLELFTNTAAADEPGQNLHVDVAQIRNIIKINSFSQEPTLQEHCCAGIWLLPSFINHSCIPNASRFHAGKGLIIHAAAEIQAGEEITIPYFNPTFPLEYRKTKAEAWNFQCVCKRCQVEKSVQNHLQDLNKSFDSVFNEARKEYTLALRYSLEFAANPDFMAACKELSKIYKRIMKRISSLEILTSVEKNWVVASYSSAFFAEWFRDWNVKHPSHFEGSFGIAVELMEALKVCVPGCAWNWSFITKLASLAFFGIGHNKVHAAYLKEQAADECIRVFGKQKPEVITQLMEKDLDAIPSMFLF